MLEDSYKHKGLRRILIKKIAEKGIKSTVVLQAMERVPRHVFLDNAFLEQAYKDIAFPIGEGQTISQPFTVAFQSELLEIKTGDRVLEIGTGSGYQSAVLHELGAVVFSIERNKFLHQKYIPILKKLGYTSGTYILGDGTLGLPQHAPFNKIIVTAGAPIIPPKLIDQLSIGGIMVIPVGDEGNQTMLRLQKTADGKLVEERFNNFRFVPLIGADGWNK